MESLTDVTQPLLYVVTGLLGLVMACTGLAVEHNASSRRAYKVGERVMFSGVLLVCITLIEAVIVWMATYTPPRR